MSGVPLSTEAWTRVTAGAGPALQLPWSAQLPEHHLCTLRALPGDIDSQVTGASESHAVPGPLQSCTARPWAGLSTRQASLLTQGSGSSRRTRPVLVSVCLPYNLLSAEGLWDLA